MRKDTRGQRPAARGEPRCQKRPSRGKRDLLSFVDGYIWAETRHSSAGTRQSVEKEIILYYRIYFFRSLAAPAQDNLIVDFIFPNIVDNRFVNHFVNDSRENETKRFGLGKTVVNLTLV